MISHIKPCSPFSFGLCHPLYLKTSSWCLFWMNISCIQDYGCVNLSFVDNIHTKHKKIPKYWWKNGRQLIASVIILIMWHLSHQTVMADHKNYYLNVFHHFQILFSLKNSFSKQKHVKYMQKSLHFGQSFCTKWRPWQRKVTRNLIKLFWARNDKKYQNFFKWMTENDILEFIPSVLMIPTVFTSFWLI